MEWSSKKVFEFCSYRTSGNTFEWARTLKKNKKGIEENYITTFNTSKSGFICQRRTILKIEFQKLNLRLSIFAARPKKVIGIIHVERKKVHRMNQCSNFLGGSFSGRDNIKAPMEFKKER